MLSPSCLYLLFSLSWTTYSLCTGPPVFTSALSQQMPHTTASMVLQKFKFNRVIPLFKTLQWLPFAFRIKSSFTTCILHISLFIVCFFPLEYNLQRVWILSPLLYFQNWEQSLVYSGESTFYEGMNELLNEWSCQVCRPQQSLWLSYLIDIMPCFGCGKFDSSH